MTAKEKAEHIIAQFATELLSQKQGKECAIIHITEILEMELTNVAHHQYGMELISSHEFYKHVLEEVKKQ